MSRPQFAACSGKTDSYTLWSCREDVWESDFRGKTVDGKSFPNNRFSAVFFQPFYAGQTFGLGQVNPLTALMLSDLVCRVSGYPKLNEKNAGAVYSAIMDPDISLAFVAASIRQSIEDYKQIAGMDISENPGLTATLYNVGNSHQRAAALAAKNRDARHDGLAGGELLRLADQRQAGRAQGPALTFDRGGPVDGCNGRDDRNRSRRHRSDHALDPASARTLLGQTPSLYARSGSCPRTGAGSDGFSFCHSAPVRVSASAPPLPCRKRSLRSPS